MLDSAPPFELKADQYTLPTLMVRGVDAGELDALLGEKTAQAPNFFSNTPVVLDLSQLDTTQGAVDFAVLVGILRGHGLVPVGIRGGSAQHLKEARLMELAVLSASSARPVRPPRAAPPPAAPVAPAAPEPLPEPAWENALVVDTPVRSGQRIYARRADLVLLAPSSSGTELMADGHIHAYGAVRGRLMAGVTGREDAQIFCHGLYAELVSIAGRYKVSEDLDDRQLGRAVRIWLEGNRLVFKRLQAA